MRLPGGFEKKMDLLIAQIIIYIEANLYKVKCEIWWIHEYTSIFLECAWSLCIYEEDEQ